LLEQVAEPARDHAAGGGATEQAAEAALQEVTETAAHSATHVAAGQTGIDCVG
jgi:hypothetical protein